MSREAAPDSRNPSGNPVLNEFRRWKSFVSGDEFFKNGLSGSISRPLPTNGSAAAPQPNFLQSLKGSNRKRGKVPVSFKHHLCNRQGDITEDAHRTKKSCRGIREKLTDKERLVVVCSKRLCNGRKSWCSIGVQELK